MSILNAIGILCVIFIQYYIKEKGKNIATKEDIQDITKKTEEIKIEFHKEFERFSTETRFKHDYFSKQYSELYSKLYQQVIQSEYIRYFTSKYQGTTIPFNEAPYLEINKKRTNIKTDIRSGMSESKSEIVNDVITDFKKAKIAETIINQGHLVSQSLLKRTIAYRFVQDNYSGADNPAENLKIRSDFDIEEVELIRNIISNIIKDYNYLRKQLNLVYNEEELETGLFDLKEFHNQTN